MLCQDYLAVIPTDDPSSGVSGPTVAGSPLGSANILFSDDLRYAYYTSSIADQISQHEIDNSAIVGLFPVGDDPNVSPDQASSLAVTPDGTVMAVLNFISNQLDLLSDTTVLKQTKFIHYQDRFTGLTVLNLSDTATDVTVTAIDSGGNKVFGTDIVNPVTLSLDPNAQQSLDVAQLFNLDYGISYSGRLILESAQPLVTGFTSIGRVQANFFDPFISDLQSIPFNPDYRKQLYDWIIPEFPQASDASTEFNFVNPNFNSAAYDIIQYALDGTVLEESSDNSIGASILDARSASDFVSSTQTGQVLIHGGVDGVMTRNAAERYDRIIEQINAIKGMSLSEFLGKPAPKIDEVDFPPYGKTDADIFENNLLEVTQFVFNHTTFDPAEYHFAYLCA